MSRTKAETGHVRDKRFILRQITEQGPHAAFGSAHILAEQARRAAGGRTEAEESVQQGGFSRAVRAQESDAMTCAVRLFRITLRPSVTSKETRSRPRYYRARSGERIFCGEEFKPDARGRMLRGRRGAFRAA